MASHWVKLVDFAPELAGYKAEVSVRQMAQKGKLTAKKKGKTWWVDADAESAVNLLEQARAYRKEQARKNQERAEECRIHELAEHATERINELENAIAERNGIIDELRRTIDEQAKRIASLERSLAIQNARVEAYREAIGAKHPTTPKPASETPQKGVESLLTAWESARRENSRVKMREVAESLGVSESELRKAVRRERDRKRREMKKKAE